MSRCALSAVIGDMPRLSRTSLSRRSSHWPPKMQPELILDPASIPSLLELSRGITAFGILLLAYMQVSARFT
jgi:hypothetical protein